MTRIIGLVQVKGGAGRSTVSTNLAGELSRTGKTVLIEEQAEGQFCTNRGYKGDSKQ